jgi:hypothetical protein
MIRFVGRGTRFYQDGSSSEQELALDGRLALVEER